VRVWPALFCLLLLVFGCSSENLPGRSPAMSGDLPETRSTTGGETGAVRTELRHAGKFTVTCNPSGKEVAVQVPWRSPDDPLLYLLIPRGAAVPAGFNGHRVVEVPVRSVVALSTTYLAHMESLGLLDTLVGLANFNHVCSPAVRQLIEQGRLAEVGEHQTVNVELLIELDPDLVLGYGIGVAEDDNHPALFEAGLDMVLTTEFLEPTPLARAEWIKFIALFFGREAEAEVLFRRMEQRYLELQGLARDAGSRPTVLLNADFQGVWYLPGGRSYMATLLHDAGAGYIWDDDTTSTTAAYDAESVFERGARADFWLNPGQARSLDELLSLDRRYSFFDAVQQCRVYNCTARLGPGGGNDIWETGVANPHLVLADLVRIFHPGLLPDHQLIWYDHLDCPADP
jgi:iron complex transport system substrate-binding protein